MRELLARRGFRLLLLGQGVSAFGDWMGTFAFMALTYELTESTTAVGGILALRLLPAIFGGALAGRAIRVWDRRRLMLVMDATRAGMIALVPLVRGLWWIYVWAFLVEAASILFLPARDSSVPDLVDEEDLPLANGLVLGSSYGTIPIGAAGFVALAALPHTVVGRLYATVFWLDALTYLASFACIARLTELAGSPTHQVTEDDGPLRVREAARIPLVRAVLPGTLAVALGLGSLFSLGIQFVRDVLGASDSQFGALIACFGVGAAIGLGVLQATRGLEPLAATRAGLVTLGVIVAAFSLSPTLWPTFLGAIGFGAAVAFVLANGMGVLQSALEGPERALAFTVFHVVIRFGLAIAAVGAGVAGDFVAAVDWPVVGRLEPARIVLLASGGIVLASASFVRVGGATAGGPVRA